MRAYAMQGTPTTILIDAQGRLRRQVFGIHDDLLLGADIQGLLLEAAYEAVPDEPAPALKEGCDETGCAVVE